MTTSNSEQCNELKNIQYQSMLMNNKSTTQVENQTNENMDDMDDFFAKEREMNRLLPWAKLDKSVKVKKLDEYVKKYSSEHNLKKEESQELGYYLKDCLERRKLQRQKDIQYDKQAGIIKSIPNLAFNKGSGKFTLKVSDKKQSITRGLAPKTNKKGGKTLKKKSREKEQI